MVFAINPFFIGWEFLPHFFPIFLIKAWGAIGNFGQIKFIVKLSGLGNKIPVWVCREYKINFGPGYRIYFAYDGKKIILLLAGGTKKRQSKDIDTAKVRWKIYKADKR